MVSWSKLPPGFSEVECCSLGHSWTKSCFLAAVDMFLASFVGSTKFFTLVYLCQFLTRTVKKQKKSSFKDTLKTQLRSTVFAALTATVTISSSCLLRKILGKYYYYTIIMIPASIGGCAIFLENRKSRELFTNAFCNCVLEYWINHLKEIGLLKWNSNHQTIIFMILSSLLSYLLATTDYHQQYFWFFLSSPKTGNKSVHKAKEKVCLHEEDCLKHSLKLFLKYSITGYVIQIIRLFLSNISSLNIFVMSLLNPKNFKLAAFLGGYVVVYQAVRCYFFQKYEKYSPVHDATAGLLAGSTFRFQPSINILNSAIICIIQILTEMSCRANFLPNFPYLELVFSITCGILFHSRIMHYDLTPKLMIYIMATITHRRTDSAAIDFEKIVKKLSAS